MKKNNNNSEAAPKADEASIQSIAVEGFKSFRKKQKIDLAPLTILAGANSSGKSSIMQPLLLMKQTLDASFDPGVFKLDGPNVDFSDQDQFLFKSNLINSVEFKLNVIKANEELSFEYEQRDKLSDLILTELKLKKDGHLSTLHMDMTHKELEQQKSIIPATIEILKMLGVKRPIPYNLSIEKERCFFSLSIYAGSRKVQFQPIEDFSKNLESLIHLPGLRGNPLRIYRKIATGPMFPGLFPVYVASIILSWMEKSDPRLDKLGKALQVLGLTWKVEAKSVSGVGIEVKVGRLPKKGKNGVDDMVNIADVGVGVSQVLPVVVALLTAEKGRIVYIEQPEIHLHPRAQVAMAKLLLDAAKRGVIVVAETHSQFLLLAVQELIAAGKYKPDLVKLHWFQRKPNGESVVASGGLDENGAFDDWPEDFSDVELKLNEKYIEAATRKYQ